MAEGGQSPIVYHFDNVGTLNVIHEKKITNIEKSTIGTLVISPVLGGQRGNPFFVDHDSARTESDNIPRSERQDNESKRNEADITWLQSGKFGVHIKEPLHTGTKVYRGEQRLEPEGSRDVAIKLIEFNKKSRKEVDLLLKLQHPNIVQIIDAGEHRGAVHWIYIVIELCSQNLQDFIDENKHEPPDFEKRFSFSKQLVSGLAYLHENNIIHRDLKPENVLISMCKNFIKLSDFGMSKEMQKSRSVVTVTTVGIGSDGYRSPETYKVTIRISPRLDIFPLGLILHLLFTNGKHPFGSDPYDWSYNIRKNKNLDLSQITEFEEPNAPKKTQLTELLNRLLSRSPRDRPTAEEVKNDPFFKDTLQDDEKKIDAKVATTDVPLANPSSPLSEAQKDVKNLQGGEVENASNVQKMIKQLENLSQERAKEIGTEAALDTLSLSTSSLSSDGSKDSELSHEFDENGRNFLKDEDSCVSNKLEWISILSTRDNVKLLEETAKSMPKDSKTKPKKALHLLERRKFKKGVDGMYKLYKYEESDKLKVSLKIAGYELYLQRGREQDSLRRVQDLISSSKVYSPAELLEMAAKWHQKEKYVRSLVLLHVSHNLHKSESVSHDDEVIWIERLVSKFSDSTERLVEAGGVSRDIAIRYGLEFMQRLLNELRLLKNVSPEVGALNEAGCLVNISYICIIAGEYEKSKTFGKAGIETLEKQFGADITKYEQYGMLLNNVGLAYQKSGDNSHAEKYLVAAMEGYKKAKDLPEEKRKKLINRMIKYSQRVRKRSAEISS